MRQPSIWQLTTRPSASKMRGMRSTPIQAMLLLSIPAALCAELTEQDAYARLASGLKEEVQVLAGITDATSAAAAVPALSSVLQKLAALSEQVNEKELWLYIDNTPDLKQPLVEEVEKLFVQLQRLEEARCYACKPLQSLLAPILKAPADKPQPRRSPSAGASPASGPAQHP